MDAPPVIDFGYSFDALTDLTAGPLDQLGVTRHAMYVQDYGAPIGWRLRCATPMRSPRSSRRTATATRPVSSTASGRRCGPTIGSGDLTPETVTLSFRTKVVGPILLAKHVAPHMPADGSFVFFSGSPARKPAVGMLALGATNAAADAVVRALAVELAPIRVNAILTRQHRHRRLRRPGRAEEGSAVRRTQRTQSRASHRYRGDIADAVVFALTNAFLTGVSLAVDGGEPLV